MGTADKKKEKKKEGQKVLLKQKEADQKLLRLLEALEELEKEEKPVEVQVCLRCKSPKVRRITTMNGDMFGHMGWLPVKFECLDCGWRGRLVVKATNRNLGVKDLAIIAEAHELTKQLKK